MTNDILKYKKVYDDTYNNNENYNYYDEIKNMYVDTYATFVDGKMLDAGCGEGIHLKRLLKKEYDIFGIELSEVCCNRYLQGFPHENIDIVSFAKKSQQFAGIICMDVIEHIPLDDVDETLKALSAMGPSVFLGIANHSDIIDGVQLHLIQEDSNWWINLLKKYYKDVILVEELYDGMFFCIQCDNARKDNYNKYATKIYESIRVLSTLQEQQKKEKQLVDIEKNNLKHEAVCLQEKIVILEHEKISLGEKLVNLEKVKVSLEQKIVNLEQEKTILYNRYQSVEKFRTSQIGKMLSNIRNNLKK